jgi:N-acetylglucosamine kinase-like BadF-type ATPase
MSDELVLGIDGGGSKALVAVADRNGRILRVARGEGLNPLNNRDWRGALRLLLQPFAVDAALAAVAAALPAYGEVDAISSAQRDAIADAFGRVPRRVLNDVDAAHIGAFAGGPGILILSGTGSMAWARDAAGRSYRVGGWGDAIGDEGSAHWIGRRILGLVSQSLDGRAEPTALADAVFEQLRIGRANPMDGLEGWVSQLHDPRSEIAALAPLATRLAATGDAGATAIVRAAAEELARHVTSIARLAELPPDWSYAGGAFRSRVLREAVAALVGRPPRLPKLPPIGGALLAAAEHLRWRADPAWVERLAASLHAASDKNGELQPIN